MTTPTVSSERNANRVRLCSALVWLAALLSGALSAQDLRVTVPATAARPGDLIALEVTVPPAVTAVTITTFDTQWPAIRVDAATWRGVVGVDLDQPPGSYPLTIEAAGPSSTLTHGATLRVVARQFRRRMLRVAPDYVNPPPDLLARIMSEARFLEGVFAASDAEGAWRDGFVRPVPGRANSSFGTRSVFNGEARNPHAGTDFLSGAGTPIRAPAGGRVVAARELYFSGNTVILDHGLGMFSMLAHMSRMDVREGQVVTRGEIVGLVGATGRVTGPHLHWALRLGAARVDPLSALRVLPAVQ